MPGSLFDLPAESQISPYLSLRQRQQLPLIVINHPLCRAVISLQGAQLLAWQPVQQHPVIWLSDKSKFETGKAIRGGIPLCWPWFADAGQPAHGFARTQPWTLLAHHGDEKGINLTFKLSDNEVTRRLWPHSFTLLLRFKLGNTCHIELEIFADHHSTAALHSYFAVSDIKQVSVSGLGSHYIDKVLNNKLATQSGPQHYLQQVDRIFTDPNPVSVINDSHAGRQIIVQHHENSDVVTWNPGAEKCCAMEDMSHQAYQKMVCVETARISRPFECHKDQPAHLAVSIAVGSGGNE